MKAVVATILVVLSCAFANAQNPQVSQGPRVLSFSQWKTQQVTEFQNKAARLSNKLTLIKSDSAQKQPVKPLELELDGVNQALEIAKEYTVDHYVATYLNQFADSREALLELSQITSKEEMADLLAAILKAKPGALTALPKVRPNTL